MESNALSMQSKINEAVQSSLASICKTMTRLASRVGALNMVLQLRSQDGYDIVLRDMYRREFRRPMPGSDRTARLRKKRRKLMTIRLRNHFMNRARAI